MPRFCGYDPQMLPDPGGNVFTRAIQALEAIPNIQLPSHPDIESPPLDQHSIIERALMLDFETMVRQSSPFLVNVDTAGI